MVFNFKGDIPPQNNSKEAPISPKEKLIADKFLKLVNSGKFSELVLATDNIENIKKTILEHKARLAPGDFSVDEVIKELIKIGTIKPIEIPKKTIENKKEVEIYNPEPTEKIKGVTQVELPGAQLRIIEANLLWEEAHKRKIFKNSEDLNETHEKSLSLGETRGDETIEYYNGFKKAGLIQSEGLLTPDEVVDKDFRSIGKRQNQFAEEAPKDPILYKKYIEAKKIATIVERSLAYCCTKGGWYGEKVRIILTSLFDDIKRGVDEVFLIEKDNEKHDVLGLGVDATFRGLKSELFKEKFSNLLKSIKANHKTKIKYFKDHNGKMMREFSIPKIILHFDIEDVKEFVDILKNVDEDGEQERIMNSYLKNKVMSQIISSCKILAIFAKDSQNSVFRDYFNVLNSIEELSWENEDMQELIKFDENDEVSKYYKELIKEHKYLKAMKLR